MSRYRCFLWIILGLLLGGYPKGAPAQDAETGLTLAAAIDLALTTSPLLRAAQQQVEATTAGMARAQAALLPSVDVAASLTVTDNPVFAFSAKLNQGRFRQDDFDVGRLNRPPTARDVTTSVTLTQPLYTGGKARAGLTQARAQSEASKRDLSRQQQSVVFQVVRAYFGVVRAQAEVGVVSAAIQAALAHYNLAQARVQSGLAVMSDVLSADVRLAELRQHELVARHQVSLAKASVNDVLGRPLDTPWTPLEALTQRPGRRPQWEGLDTMALEQRPDYQQLGLTEQMLEQGVAMARAEFLPTLQATARYDVHTRNAVSDGQGSWLVVLGMQWNVFHGLGDRAKVTEAQAQVGRLKALRARAASQIALEVKEAFLGLQAAQQRIDVTAGARSQAQESLRIIRDRYETGLATIVDLLSNEAALTRAQAQHTQALYDYNVGLSALELALGTISQDTY